MRYCICNQYHRVIALRKGAGAVRGRATRMMRVSRRASATSSEVIDEASLRTNAERH